MKKKWKRGTRNEERGTRNEKRETRRGKRKKEKGKRKKEKGERKRERESESESERKKERKRVRFSTLSSLVSSSNFCRAHSLLFLVMPSRWSNQQFRGPWSWYGRWERLNEAGRSWTWSSSQKGDGEWKLVTRKRKKWANGTVSIGGMSSSASSDASVDKSAIKAHRTFVEVVLGDSGAQPTKISEPEQQKLAASSVSLPLSVTTSPWLVTKPRWNAIWRQPKTSFQELSAHCN